MRSISEFIQEQETGTSYVGSDNLVKLYAETAAAISLAQCYTEQAVIAEFAAENDVNSLRIVQEAGEETKPGIFKRAGNAIAGAWKKFIEFIKSIIAHIKEFFKGKKVATAEKRLEELDPTTQITVDANVLYPVFSQGIIDAFVEKFRNTKAENSNNYYGIAQLFEDKAKDITSIINGEAGTLKSMAEEYSDIEIGEISDNGTISMTVGQFKKYVKDMKDVKTEQKLNKILTELSRIETEYAKILDITGVGYDDPEDDAKGVANSKKKLADNMKSFMNALTKLNDKAMKFMNSIDSTVDKLIKNSHGNNGVENRIGGPKQESAYFV